MSWLSKALSTTLLLQATALPNSNTDIIPSDPGPGGNSPIRPFRLDQVRLGPGLLQEKRDRITSFLHDYDERRFLILFNNQAGRPNPEGISVPGGWEDGGLLSGHWTGHFMTALSQAYAEQGDDADVYKDKLDWMVAELAACQKAITARMEGATTNISSPIKTDNNDNNNNASWIPTHPGYLGALPEDTVLRLGPPRWAIYGSDAETDTWAPWYTQHKIMRGLLDAYYHTNNTQALDIVVEMANWAHLALTIGDMNHPDYPGNLTRDDLNYMWDLHIAGEYGGANEVFSEVYQLTGDAQHLDTARAFDNRESLFGAAVDDNDILVVRPDAIPGRRRAAQLHANTHVPQFVGYMRIYEHSGEEAYHRAARNFYTWVAGHRQFAHGGTGGGFPNSTDNPELFQNRDNIANAMEFDGAETCTTYNMLKLARDLFLHEKTDDAAYMDNYERGLFNMIAGSRADQDSLDEPMVTYFQPLTPGAVREYGNTGTCCGGTGMESHTKYQETVYLRSADGSTLWVNLYVPSTLNWEEKGFKVTQETAFPRGDTVKLTITGDGKLDIKLRVPGWVGKGFHVALNGEQYEIGEADPGTYLSLSRTWKTGDEIEIRMPFSIRVERALDRPDTQSLMWGPILLQILGSPGNSSFQELSLYKDLKLDGDYSAAITQTETTAQGDPLFTTGTGTGSSSGNLTIRPYYISDDSPASSYFRRVEPVVVFGSVDTGIPNQKRDDGLPDYDVPVGGIESPGNDGPTFLDLVWDRAPFGSHESFVEAVTDIADAFVAAGVYTTKERGAIIAGAEEAKGELAVD